MSHRQRAGRDVGLHVLGQGEQPLVVRDRRAVLADGLRNLLLRPFQLVGQPAVGARFLDRVEVLALDVFDQRQLQPLFIGNVAHDHRDLQQPGAQRGAPAPFAGHDLVLALLAAAHHDRLEDPGLLDRCGQRVEPLFIHVAPRLLAIRLDQVEIDLERAVPPR